MIKYTDFFDLISMDNEVLTAGLFMTYGFDAELFEKHMLPGLLSVIGNNETEKNDLRFRYEIASRLREVPITVISDAKQYHGGQTFLYDHIVVKTETFHPKCYILLYQTYLRVIIGSCNITKAGLCYNAETIWYEDITKHTDDSLASNLKEILEWMAEKYNIYGNYAVKEVLKFLEGCMLGNSYPKLIHTVGSSSVFSKIFDELKQQTSECKEINIVSPFFENDRERAIEKSLLMKFADSFKSLYPKSKIKIYFPAMAGEGEKAYKVTAPVNIFTELCNKYKNTELYVINREWIREDEESVPRNLHAKIIIVEFKNNKRLILSGSINFTNNAMRSYNGSLRNIEVGVLEYGNIHFMLPDSKKVKVDELEYEDRKVEENEYENFVESAVLDGKKLTITLLADRLFIPFEVEYQDNFLCKVDSTMQEIVIEAFSLKRAMDLHIVCDNFDFYVPIQILNKEEFVTEDLKLNFTLEMKDIVDYLAGKYRSMSEIERMKRVQKLNDKTASSGLSVYFRYNLQRYYKAMASLKQGLEMPYYSEMAFKNYLVNPIGIKNLLQFIVDDYKEEKADREDTFLFIVEIEDVIRNLKFQEEHLDVDFKKCCLMELMEEPVKIRKNIYKRSNKVIRDQYDVLLKTYGLDVR